MSNGLQGAEALLSLCRADGTLRRRDAYDQCPATTQTTLRRVAMLDHLEPLSGTRILLLGDDDLLSLALAAHGAVKQITVLDVDRALLAFIRRWSDRQVRVVRQDIRRELAESLLGNFDVVFMDPPYTPPGQLVFLMRAFSALCPGRAGAIYLCASRIYLTEVHLRKLRAIAVRNGFRLTHACEDFNEYETPPNMRDDLLRRGDRPERFCSALFRFAGWRTLGPVVGTRGGRAIYRYLT